MLAENVWRVLAVSLAGTSHVKFGTPCQDAHLWKELPSGVLAAAVADGAGSAALAEVGAEVAARRAVEALTEAVQSLPETEEAWKTLMFETLRQARQAVESEAALREVETRELATTLIVLLATPERVGVAQIGDGATVVSEETGELTALTTPESGEFVNETTFLVSPDALEQAQVRLWQGMARHIALFSDGLQRLALKTPEDAPHPQFFAPLFRFIAEAIDTEIATQQLTAFLSSPRVTERTDDDLTLLLALRHGSLP